MWKSTYGGGSINSPRDAQPHSEGGEGRERKRSLTEWITDRKGLEKGYRNPVRVGKRNRYMGENSNQKKDH